VEGRKGRQGGIEENYVVKDLFKNSIEGHYVT
jgi:hypothetical protein